MKDIGINNNVNAIARFEFIRILSMFNQGTSIDTTVAQGYIQRIMNLIQSREDSSNPFPLTGDLPLHVFARNYNQIRIHLDENQVDRLLDHFSRSGNTVPLNHLNNAEQTPLMCFLMYANVNNESEPAARVFNFLLTRSDLSITIRNGENAYLGYLSPPYPPALASSIQSIVMQTGRDFTLNSRGETVLMHSIVLFSERGNSINRMLFDANIRRIMNLIQNGADPSIPSPTTSDLPLHVFARTSPQILSYLTIDQLNIILNYLASSRTSNLLSHLNSQGETPLMSFMMSFITISSFDSQAPYEYQRAQLMFNFLLTMSDLSVTNIHGENAYLMSLSIPSLNMLIPAIENRIRQTGNENIFQSELIGEGRGGSSLGIASFHNYATVVQHLIETFYSDPSNRDLYSLSFRDTIEYTFSENNISEVEHGDNTYKQCTLYVFSDIHEEVGTLLLSHGADINYPDASGRTLFHLAVENRNFPMLESLLDMARSAGIVIDLTIQHNGRTALQLAQDNGFDLAVDLLSNYVREVEQAEGSNTTVRLCLLDAPDVPNAHELKPVLPGLFTEAHESKPVLHDLFTESNLSRSEASFLNNFSLTACGVGVAGFIYLALFESESSIVVLDINQIMGFLPYSLTDIL